MAHRWVAIDCYNWKILWLFVGSSNNDAKVKAYYFVNCVVNLQLVPRLIRAGKGSENVVVAGIQRYFRKNGENDMAEINSFKFGPSTRNQWIDAWWSILRQTRFSWWINFLKSLCETGNLDPSKPFRLEVKRFCFIELIQIELDKVKDMWNNHKIRPVRNGERPSGKPNVLYIALNLTGGINSKFPVSEHDVILAKSFSRKPSLFGCSDDIADLCHAIVQEKVLTIPSTAMECKTVFNTIITDVENNRNPST